MTPSAERKASALATDPPRLSRRFQQAFVFAADKHSGQRRKQTPIPYIAHLMSVAALVLEAGADEEQAMAALLHDVVEDCGGKPMLEEVRDRFGDRVAHIVEGCSDSFTVPKPPWREREETYLNHLRQADHDVRFVSSADKLHNAREILKDLRLAGDSVFQRFRGKREGTLWYYRALADELRTENNWIVQELDRTVSEIERLARVKDIGVDRCSG